MRRPKATKASRCVSRVLHEGSRLMAGLDTNDASVLSQVLHTIHQRCQEECLAHTQHLRVMTFNVQAYESANTSGKRRALLRVITKWQPDIVALQEDFEPRPLRFPPSYVEVTGCRAEPLNGGYLRNTILVRKELQQAVTVVNTDELDVTADCQTPRCVTAIDVGKRLRLANVHLCGGRYDDPHFEAMVDTKAKQIAALVEHVKPDMIVGDFNGGMYTTNQSGRSLRKYPLFRNQCVCVHFTCTANKLTADRKKVFMRYIQSAHTYLKARGYRMLYTEESLGQPTSAYGGTPDWMFVRPVRMTGVRMIKHYVVAALDCSDHNAVVVDIEIH